MGSLVFLMVGDQTACRTSYSLVVVGEVEYALRIVRSGKRHTETCLTESVSMCRRGLDAVRPGKSKSCGGSRGGVQSVVQARCIDESFG